MDAQVKCIAGVSTDKLYVSGPKTNPPSKPCFVKSGNTYWHLRHIRRWSVWSGTSQGQLEETRRDWKQLNESRHHYSHPSQVAAVGGKWLSFTPAGATLCQQSLGLEGWNCSLTLKGSAWLLLEGLWAYLASVMVIFPLFASSPDCEQYIKLTVWASFDPTDNPFQLKAEVLSAELWSTVVHGGHEPLEWLYLGYRDT